MKTQMIVKMDDGSTWSVPIEAIANNRAEHYKHEFDDNLELSLKEDTIPLFESDEYEIEDWAVNNMNWSDVSHLAKMVTPPVADYQEGWMNGDKSFA